MRVMVVEDARSVRQRLTAAFRKAPDISAVCEVETGELALELVESWRPDVILLDLMLPGMSGLDVLSALRERGSRPAVVIHTNYPYPALRNRCQEMGAAEFLVKSTRLSRILEVVRSLAEYGDARERSPGPGFPSALRKRPGHGRRRSPSQGRHPHSGSISR